MMISNIIRQGTTINIRCFATQKLFLDKVAEYKKKSNADDLLESDPKSQAMLHDEVDRMRSQFGFKKGEKDKIKVSSRFSLQSFHDTLKLRVIAGAGGHGCPSSKAIGGKGGNVIIEAADEIDDLSHVNSKFPDGKAEAVDGLDGRRTRLVGPDGDDCIVKVPCGVTVFNEFMSPISDLVKNGDRTIAAYGGHGGTIRNNFFGTSGQSQLITLDLRYLADIGLVGYPDSGKSLLLTKLLTSGKFLIGSQEKSYKTKRPWLGDIKFQDGRRISCVDLPSIPEEAHKHKRGQHHLKHLYHNQMIIFVIDVHGFKRGIFRKATETLLALNKQIEIYDERYLTKPALIVVNKMDLPGADVAFEEFLVNLKNIYSDLGQFDFDKSILPRKLINYQDIIPISCLKDRNIDFVKQRIRELIDFNYLNKRHVDCPRTFVSLLERVQKSRTQTKVQLL